jgi:hypothetical protein
MAATVLNGSGNLSYTNNTGGNVRAIIYYMSSINSGGNRSISFASSFGTATMTSSGDFSLGKDLAGSTSFITNASVTSQNVGSNANFPNGGIPTQIMLANGQTISAVCGGYNIAIIPENG